jgi:hypothetical protein
MIGSTYVYTPGVGNFPDHHFHSGFGQHEIILTLNSIRGPHFKP